MKQLPLLSYLQKLLTGLSDLLFPPAPEEKLLRTVNLSTLHTLYQPEAFQNIIYLCHYGEPIIQAAVIENKFHHSPLAASHLGTTLEMWVSKQTESTILVPIPLGKKRLRERGHNQVDTIIKAMTTSVPTTNKLLRRKIETLPQSKLNKFSRTKNIKDAFQYTGNKNDLSAYSQVVLVDDVVTTGSTLRAARATLAPHLHRDAKIICLAIAH